MGAKTHIQSWAPQDARTSKVRMRSIVDRDPWLRVVWREIIDSQFEHGEPLERDVSRLSSDLGIPRDELLRCLVILGPSDLGFLTSDEGPIENARVTSELEEVQEFRKRQSDRGRRGGTSTRERHGLVGAAKESVFTSSSTKTGGTQRVLREGRSTSAASAAGGTQRVLREGRSGIPAGDAAVPQPSSSSSSSTPTPLRREEESLSTELLLLSTPEEPQKRKRGSRKNGNEDGPTPEDLLRVWNENRGELPEAVGLNATRRGHAVARLKEHPTLEAWANVVRDLAASPWHQGQNERSWRATFDFLVKPDTFTKAAEGMYKPRRPNPTPERITGKYAREEYPDRYDPDGSRGIAKALADSDAAAGEQEESDELPPH